jgi:uncharacterized membrane protein YkgB
MTIERTSRRRDKLTERLLEWAAAQGALTVLGGGALSMLAIGATFGFLVRAPRAAQANEQLQLKARVTRVEVRQDSAELVLRDLVIVTRGLVCVQRASGDVQKLQQCATGE